MRPAPGPLLLGCASAATAILIARALWPAEAPPVVELTPSSEEPEWVLRLEALDQREERFPVQPRAGSTLVRERVPDGPRVLLFPAMRRKLQRMDHDLHTYWRRKPDLRQRISFPEHPEGGYQVRTNSMGLRMDSELSAAVPDLRVVISGDSHIDGIGNNSETLAARLRAELSDTLPGRTVEVINASAGGYCAYNYLGALERHLPDKPQAFVAVLNGGNDFADALGFRHFFERTKRSPGSSRYPELMEPAVEREPGGVAQCFDQLIYLKWNPGEVPLAVDSTQQCLLEGARLAQEHEVAFLVLYLPPAIDVEWQRHADSFEWLAGQLQLSPTELGLAGRMADQALEFLRAARVPVIDAREQLEPRTGGPGLFWPRDFHLSPDGHAQLAASLAPRLLALLPH